MSFAISFHICENKSQSTCSWQRAPALCLRSTMGSAPAAPKMLIKMKIPALQPQEDTRLKEAFPISERSMTYRPSLHSKDCDNSKHQNAGGGKCSSPPTAPQEPEGTMQAVTTVDTTSSEPEHNLQPRQPRLGTHSCCIWLEQTLFMTQSGLKV